MKTILILLAGICAATVAAFSQDSFDPQPIIGRSGTGMITKPSQTAAFTFEKYAGTFIRGWNWGAAGSLLDEAMHMNMYHGIADYTRYGLINYTGSWSFSADFKKGMFVVEPFLDCKDQQILNSILPRQYLTTDLGAEVAGSEWTNAIMNAQALHLEPTLDVVTSELGVQELEGTIFGFREKQGRLSVINNLQYQRFEPTDIPITQTALTALKGAWRTDILRFQNCRRPPLEIGCSGKTSKEDLRDQNENQPLDRNTFHEFNGKRFYLSINLQAEGIPPASTAQLPDNLVLLTVKIPARHVKWAKTGNQDDALAHSRTYTERQFVMFDSTPRVSGPNGLLNSTDTIQIRSTEPLISTNILGVANRAYSYVQSKTEEFQITVGMLRQFASTGTPITLSAHMTFMGGTEPSNTDPLIGLNGLDAGTTPYDNPRLLPRDFSYRTGEEEADGEREQVGMTYGSTYIDSLDVEVTYHGKVPVLINWVRLETPRAQKLFRGYYDLYLRANVQKVINLVYQPDDKPTWVLSDKAPSGSGNKTNGETDPLGWKLCGIYGMDETGPLHYSSMRYVNRLLNGELKQEQFSRASIYYNINRDIENNCASHLQTMTGMGEFWNGSNIFLGGGQMSPLVRWGKQYFDDKVPDNNKVDMLGFSGGYAGYETDIHGTHVSDSLKSGYETDFISNHFCIAPNTGGGAIRQISYDDDPYTKEWPYPHVVLSSVQSRMERDLHDCYYKQPGLLFSGNTWWANVWIDPGILIYPSIKDPSIKNNLRTIGHKDRFRTAEEVRAQIWLPVLFGAKGLVYWYKNSNGLVDEGDNVAQRDAESSAQLGLCSYDFIRAKRTYEVKPYSFTDLHRSNSPWQNAYKALADNANMKPADWLRNELLGGDYLDRNQEDATPHLGKKYAFVDNKGVTLKSRDPLLNMAGYEWEKMGWNTCTETKDKNDPNKTIVTTNAYETIYTGMKNTRIEIEKLHRMIMDNESYIMGLKFMACYGKGFIKMYAQDPSSGSAFDGYKDTILKKYLDISATLTRPLVRISQEGAAVAEYEQNHGLDSGFYDITLFTNPAVKIESSAINRTHEDSSIVIGVMNRRTDPLFRYVRTQASAAGHEGDTYNRGQMTYLTTAEWDSLKSTGGVHWKVPNDSRTKEWWQARYNERLGGREITLKFLYKSTATSDPDSKGKLLRVREIVASGVRGLDTIVSSTSYLAINFEPGEGKLLEVTMRVPENSVSEGTGANDGVGSLLNTGQRKIVAVPRFLRMENGTPVYDSNQIRYHLVYHRKAGEATNGAELRDVYYKRSRYVQRSFSGIGASSNLVNGLEWEPEVLVSQYLMPHNIPSTRPHNDKAFPSIVVRFDNESQTMKAFIVFAAQSVGNSGGLETTGGIYESCFNVDEPNIASILTPANYLDSLARPCIYDVNKGEILSNYGHPVINAHADGQYVCYSDRSRGIVALWQSRNWPNNSGLLRRENIFGDRSYNTVEYIEVDDQTGYPDRSKYAKLLEEISVKEHCGPSSLHPSINTYTDYETNNVDALLAWDETSKNLYDQDSRQILAAVLSHTASSIVMRPIERTQYCWTNRDGTIACISECGRGKKFQEPVVIEQPTVALTNAKARNYYQIAWRKDRFTLYEKPAWISASNSGTPFYPNVYNTAPFPLLDYSLTATGRDLSSRELWGNTKSFQAKRFPLDIEVLDGVNHILLQPHMEWSEDFSVRGASQPRLAEYMLIDQPAQSNIARRVYRKPDASQYSAITASAAHLMKSPAASNGLDNVQLYGYGTRSQRMCMEIRDQTDRPLQLGMLAESEVDGDSLAANSLVTNWFTVGAEYPFHLLYNGTGTDFISLSIQRRGDSRAYSAEYQCTAEPSESNEVRTVSGRLLNGNNAEYRFIVKPNRKELEPTYSFFVQHNDYDDARDEELPKVLADLSTLNAISAEQIYIVAYPNPASSRVDVSIQSPGASVKQGATLTVVNILGETMYKGSVGTGGVTTLETDLWPEGMYSVRCEFRTGLTECKTAARDFIIRR
ncbi:MAG: hypothetical protein ACK5JL_08520 [Candidatus Kapaibacterium sp.]|jgi:hypothetical protein